MSEFGVMFVATSLASVHAEPSFNSELLTQVTNGVELQILEERDKWCRVRQRDGYEAWAYKPYLVDSMPIESTHMTLGAVSVFAEPEPGPVVTRIPIGTSLSVLETRDRWSRVCVCAGTMVPDGWVNALFLRELSGFPLQLDS